MNFDYQKVTLVAMTKPTVKVKVSHRNYMHPGWENMTPEQRQNDQLRMNAEIEKRRAAGEKNLGTTGIYRLNYYYDSNFEPYEIEEDLTPEGFIAYVARVSNPANQNNSETAPKLLKYLQDHKHWSPFEMVNICLEIVTTRDIGRQILRHRSFHFQEFSQRYAALGDDDFVVREPRLQDLKNRQNSVEMTEADEELQKRFIEGQNAVQSLAVAEYQLALKMGIAKEQARCMLPEGMALSRMYMNGTLRDWIHYANLRRANGTQKEHQDIAEKAWTIITSEFKSIKE